MPRDARRERERERRLWRGNGQRGDWERGSLVVCSAVATAGGRRTTLFFILSRSLKSSLAAASFSSSSLLLPAPSSSSCPEHFSYWKFAYLQIALCSAPLYLYLLQLALSVSPDRRRGACGMRPLQAGGRGNVFCILCGFWYVHCEFIERDFIAQTNVAFYKCFKSRPKDGAY